MLELKINPKDIHQDPFAIMTWKDADLAMAVMIFKPVRKSDNKQKSYQRILIGDERSILSRLRGEETVSQKVRVEAYTAGSLFKEFCRQFTLASMRRFRVKLKAYTELAEDLQQRQGYEVGIIYDAKSNTHDFLGLFDTGYSDYMNALELFKKAISERDYSPIDLGGEEDLRSCLRVLWNTNSPAAKYMSLLIWMQYRHCAGEFDRVTRYKMTGEAIDKLTRLGCAFYDDGIECLPQGNELELDDSILGGTRPEDRRDWRLRTEENLGFPGKVMLLNGSFQALKYQYVAAAKEYSIHLKKCGYCGTWFSTDNNRTEACSEECKAALKAEKDRSGKERNRRIPGCSEKQDKVRKINKWIEWARKNSTAKALEEMRGYQKKLKDAWEKYRSDYEAEADPQKQNDLYKNFMKDMRQIENAASDRKKELEKLAKIQNNA